MVMFIYLFAFVCLRTMFVSYFPMPKEDGSRTFHDFHMDKMLGQHLYLQVYILFRVLNSNSLALCLSNWLVRLFRKLDGF